MQPAVRLKTLDQNVENWLRCAVFGECFANMTGGNTAATNSRKSPATMVCDAVHWELTRQILNGDEEAFRLLVSEHNGMVTRIASRFANQRVDRDEIVNDSFSEVYFSLAKFRGDSNLPTWISTITTRRCYRFLKRQERDRKHRALLQRIGWSKESAPHEDQRLDSAREKLELIMKSLSSDDRMVLTLLYWEQCSISEIAKRLQWSESKTKVRAHRAREKMKQVAGEA